VIYTIRKWRPECDAPTCIRYALYRVWPSGSGIAHHGYYCRAHAEAMARRLERHVLARPAGGRGGGE
jgi:hypothetical protein